jgi:hypothetical protein
MKTANVGSLKIVTASDNFKKTYFSTNVESTISTSSATKKDKNDKGFYNLTFNLVDAAEVPYFLEKDNYTEEVKEFFQKELGKEIRYLSVSWNYNCCASKSFDMSIEIRF